MKYRPDIDGLRGVAVIAVLLFHAKVPPFQGGFVGVDVFFVISGFLIASQISSQLSENRFSFVSFFERRVRRLFPALFGIIIFTTIAGCICLLPQDLGFLGTSQIYSALFASNILFWKISFKYFSEGALFPLLHTWSLGVEEQFYIVAPFAFVFLYGMGRRVVFPWICTLAGISFIAFAWGTLKAGPGAFYLAPLRAWEFASGALVALSPSLQVRGGRWRGALEMVGVLLVISAIVTNVLGPIGVLLSVTQAVLGTSVLISAGSAENSFVRRLLSLGLVRGAGLISYSLYLWHWPILTFIAAYISRNPTVLESCGALVATFPIAYLSWRYIENPFRAANGVSSLDIRLMAEATTLCVLLSGFILRNSSGFPGRLSAPLKEFIREDSAPKRFASREDIDGLTFPRIGRASSAPPRFLVWGDSHAEAAAPALDLLSEKYGRTGFLAAWYACAPLLQFDEPMSHFGSSQECRLLNDAVMKAIPRFDIKDVIMVANWARYESDSAQFATDLRKTVETLGKLGAKVWILEDNPQLPYHPTRRAFRVKEMDLLEAAFMFPRVEHDARNAVFHRAAGPLRGDFPVHLLDPTSGFCESTMCYPVRNGKLLFRDSHHVNRLGSYQLIPALEKAFSASAATL